MNPTSKSELIIECILLIFFLLIMIFLISSFYSFREVCLNERVISKIGACSSEGRCSVKYQDGDVGEEILPIEGKRICRKYRRVFWWGNI